MDKDCPYDRLEQPQKYIDWLLARVASLEESLETALAIPFKPVAAKEPRPATVHVTTQELFEEETPTGGDVAGLLPVPPGYFEVFESSDDDSQRDIEQYPLFSARRSTSSISNFTQCGSFVLGGGCGDSDDDCIDVQEAAAANAMEKTDARNLGRIWGGMDPTPMEPDTDIMTTYEKVDSFWKFSSAQDATFEEDN